MKLPSKPTPEELNWSLYCRSKGQATKQQEQWIEQYTSYHLERDK